MQKGIIYILLSFIIIFLMIICACSTSEGSSGGDSSGGDSSDGSNSDIKIVFMRTTAWDEDGETRFTNIFTMKSDGTDVQQITFGDNEYHAPQFSKDFTKIVFVDISGNDDDEIMIMNSDGSNIVKLTDNTIYDSHPSFSYNGEKIIFERVTGWYEDGVSKFINIFTMKSDGTNVQQVTFGDNRYETPSFSFDGNKVVFVDDKLNEHSKIMIMNSDGSNIVQLSNNAISDSLPSLSPDGKIIAFERSTLLDEDGEEIYTNIFTMNIDGSNIQQITFGDNVYEHPYFSSDGNKIEFMLWDGDDEIMIMNPDGSNIIQLTNNTITDSFN